MVRRRIHLVAHHFLAHRIESHAVGDGDPRRLFVRDLLRLLVERRAVGLLGGELGLLDEVLEAALESKVKPLEPKPDDAKPAQASGAPS